MEATVCHGHMIANQWDADGLEGFESISPSDGSTVWSGASATGEHVKQATAAARQAFDSWRKQPLQERAALVTRFSELVADQSEELAQLISREMGKPLWESKTEVAAVVGKSALAIEALQSRRSRQVSPAGDAQAVTNYQPFGVLAVLGPFNLPAHLPNGHIVPAILAGNTVVFKPSEHTPAVAQWMVQRWMEAGLPAGVVNLLQGSRETAVALANEPQLDGLLFTGSSTAGRALHKAFGPWPQKILALEMSGNNPLIIHRAADIRVAAYYTILSAFITAGQRCTCARRLIMVDGHEVEALLRELVEMLTKVRIGYWDDLPQPFSSTVISKDSGGKLLQDQDDLINQGARPIVRMNSCRQNDALLSPGLLDVTEVKDRGDDEMFGPLLQLIRVRDFDAAIREANNTAYGLSSALISAERECYQQFAEDIRAGIANWNRPTTGATGKMPFGGCGLSGNNRPSGFFAADYCNWPVATLESDRLEMPETLMTGIELNSQ